MSLWKRITGAVDSGISKVKETAHNVGAAVKGALDTTVDFGKKHVKDIALAGVKGAVTGAVKGFIVSGPVGIVGGAITGGVKGAVQETAKDIIEDSKEFVRDKVVNAVGALGGGELAQDVAGGIFDVGVGMLESAVTSDKGEKLKSTLVDGAFEATEVASRIIIDHTNIVPEEYKGVAKGTIKDTLALSKNLLEIESEKKNKIDEVRHTSGLSTRERIISENEIYDRARIKTKNTLVKHVGLGAVGLYKGEEVKEYAKILVEGASDGIEQGREAKANMGSTARYTSETRVTGNTIDEPNASETNISGNIETYIDKIEEKIDNNSIISRITKPVTKAQIRVNNAIDKGIVKKIQKFGDEMKSKPLIQNTGKVAQSVDSVIRGVGNKITHNSIVTGVTQSSIVTGIAHTSIVESINNSRPVQKMKDTFTADNVVKQIKEVGGMDPVSEPEDPTDNTESLSVFLHDKIEEGITSLGDKKKENTNSTYSQLKQFSNGNKLWKKTTPTSPHASNTISLNNSKITPTFSKGSNITSNNNRGSNITSNNNRGSNTTSNNNRGSNTTSNNNRGSNTTSNNNRGSNTTSNNNRGSNTTSNNNRGSNTTSNNNRGSNTTSNNNRGSNTIIEEVILLQIITEEVTLLQIIIEEVILLQIITEEVTLLQIIIEEVILLQIIIEEAILLQIIIEEVTLLQIIIEEQLLKLLKKIKLQKEQRESSRLAKKMIDI